MRYSNATEHSLCRHFTISLTLARELLYKHYDYDKLAEEDKFSKNN